MNPTGYGVLPRVERRVEDRVGEESERAIARRERLVHDGYAWLGNSAVIRGRPLMKADTLSRRHD
jgi:hypothetical protein